MSEFFFFKKGIKEMAQPLRALMVLTEDPNSVPRIHVRWLTTAVNCSPQGSDALLLPTQATYLQAQSHRHRHIYTELKIKTLKKKRKYTLN